MSTKRSKRDTEKFEIFSEGTTFLEDQLLKWSDFFVACWKVFILEKCGGNFRNSIYSKFYFFEKSEKNFTQTLGLEFFFEKFE